ncbi:MAG: hypothetical protein QNJ72_40195 [Pleurocapsa sp. MO_226.B13]|nr:hypothetical protein [Pleurocapsa sp. MO_226.B13]
MTVEEFRQQNRQQIKNYPLALQALWYDYQDDWHRSHKTIDFAAIAIVLGFMPIYIAKREI